MPKRVITFGEVLMRNASPRHERFTQARQWEVIYGGTESNVAVALAHFGVDAAFVTAFPPNEVGQAAGQLRTPVRRRYVGDYLARRQTRSVLPRNRGVGTAIQSRV